MSKNENDFRIFLVRHGQPRQHSGKIFLGQADVPLSESGREEASVAADLLIEHRANSKRVYTSDLARARETAEIIAEKLDVPVVPDKLFREMAMGTWDGELIEDIKAKFPEEYAKRGDDPRNYRTPGGENFYDLRGRVLREFHRILAEDFHDSDDCGDLIIVAHLGVLVSLTEEIFSGTGSASRGQFFPTGSVSVFDAPDWMRPGRSETEKR